MLPWIFRAICVNMRMLMICNLRHTYDIPTIPTHLETFRMYFKVGFMFTIWA